MTLPTIREVLQQAHQLIKDPNHWTQRFDARGADGKICEINSPEATRWCMVGAIYKVCAPFADMILHERVFNHLMSYIRKHDQDIGITGFNDSHTHEQVLNMLQAATAILPMDVSNVLQTVRQIRALIEDQTHWTQGAMARTKEFESCFYADPRASEWCLLGAMYHCMNRNDDYPMIFSHVYDVQRYMANFTCNRQCISMSEFNDQRTHPEVIQLLDDMIVDLTTLTGEFVRIFPNRKRY